MSIRAVLIEAAHDHDDDVTSGHDLHSRVKPSQARSVDADVIVVVVVNLNVIRGRGRLASQTPLLSGPVSVV
jgi:hypothetical protein